MQDIAKTLRKKQTDTERLLWQHLRDRRLGGFKFRRQHPMGPYVVDFICIEKRVVVEVDGGQHSEQEAEDHRRTRFLQTQGFQVLRFWNNEVLGNLNSVLESILLALIPLTPTLSPKGRGGSLLPPAVKDAEMG